SSNAPDDPTLAPGPWYSGRIAYQAVCRDPRCVKSLLASGKCLLRLSVYRLLPRHLRESGNDDIEGPASRNAEDRLGRHRHRLSRGVDVLHAIHPCRTFEPDDKLSELPPERNFGKRAKAVADRDQAE